jgi:AcrR family transcriptional regulator
VTRAAPLPLDERRAALIAATEPLLEQFGREVSTRQIAEAAGIAEGTIFRAFATKEELIDAVIKDSFDIHRTCDELGQIDRGLSLEERLIHDSFRTRQQADNELINEAIAALIGPDQDQLRLAVMEAASALRAITFAITHPILGDQGLADPEQIVDLVLHGSCRHPAPDREWASC